ncbi:MAG: CsiV family protein [Halioglobus sp.]
MTLMNMPRHKLAATLLGLLLSSNGQAQEDRWFKVELIIFSQEAGAGAMSESWNPEPQLSYPGVSRFLLDPDLLAFNLANYDADSTVDEHGRQTLSVHPAPLEVEGDELLADEEQPMAAGKAGASNSDTGTATTSGALLTENPALEPAPLPLTPTPFTTLPGSAMEFRGKAAYMQRTGRYQIMFHEAWVQPFKPENSALPIVVDRSGDTHDWPRLQGSVKLHLSRYLHIETNLWLNTTGNYLPEFWHGTPAPLGPQSLFIEYPEVIAEIPVALPSDLPSVEIEEETPDLDWPDDIEVKESQPKYPWRHAITLQQKRRMRSGEVHYIDHPMLGVVVLITPMSEEELEAMAAIEFAPENNQEPL